MSRQSPHRYLTGWVKAIFWKERDKLERRVYTFNKDLREVQGEGGSMRPSHIKVVKGGVDKEKEINGKDYFKVTTFITGHENRSHF